MSTKSNSPAKHLLHSHKTHKPAGEKHPMPNQPMKSCASGLQGSTYGKKK